jgi:NAD-dependent deacetylase
LDPNVINQAQEAAQDCDCMIIVGTSGEVYPANTLPAIAQSSGANVIAVDPVSPFPEACPGLWLRGSAVMTVPGLIEKALQDTAPGTD